MSTDDRLFAIFQKHNATIAVQAGYVIAYINDLITGDDAEYIQQQGWSRGMLQHQEYWYKQHERKSYEIPIND